MQSLIIPINKLSTAIRGQYEYVLINKKQAQICAEGCEEEYITRIFQFMRYLGSKMSIAGPRFIEKVFPMK